MNSDLITLAFVAAYLPLVLLVHAALYRLIPALKDGPAQGPTAKVVGTAAAVTMAMLAAMVPGDSEWLSHLVFGGIALASLATFYFTFLCVSESGRRYYLLTLVANKPGVLSKSDLARAYGRDYMIDIRLSRLLSWGVIEEVDGRLFFRKWSFYVYSSIFYYWARLLGYRWF